METLKVIDSLQGIDEVLKVIESNDYVAFDIETTGLRADSDVIGISIAADEDAAYYIILSKWNKETQTLEHLPTRQAMPTIIQSLSKTQLVAHNGVFDCVFLHRRFGGPRLIESLHTDTMVLAHLLDENRRVGLKELAAKAFGEASTDEQKLMKESIVNNGGEATKVTYELYKADPYLIGKYGAKDALLTFKLFLQMVPQLYEQGLDKFFYEDESMPLLRGPTYDMNTTGIRVDVKELEKLKLSLMADMAEAKDFIYREIAPAIAEKYPGTTKKNVFNISSNPQLSWLVFGQYGLEFGTLTDEGKVVCRALGMKIPYSKVAKRDFIEKCKQNEGQVYQPSAITTQGALREKKVKAPWSYLSCDKDALERHSRAFKWIEKLLEYQKMAKLLSTYVEGIGERIEYGVIHPSFLQHGTTSGRYSSRDPNFQNLPRKDKRIKKCMISRPNRTFVGADYSQLEPRVFAYVSNDENLLNAFKSGDDFYSTIGMKVYDKTDCTPQKEGSPDAFGVKYPELRDLSKVIALATVYGATSFQLSKTTKKSPDDTQQDINNYLENFPGVAKMMAESHKLAKEHGQVVNIFGRPRRIPDATKIDRVYGQVEREDLPYNIRSLLNLSTNHRIQSSAASIVNRSAIKFHDMIRRARIDAQIVCQVHDSLVVECPETDAEQVAQILQTAMETAVDLKTIKLEAIPKIGKTFAEV